MNWIVVGLCGVTNSGKSTLAEKLRETYQHSIHVKQDDYFLPTDDPRHVIVPGLNHHNWELLTSLDMDRMVDDVQQILLTKTADLRLLILDGFLLFADPRTKNLCDVKVYLDMDFETCKARRNLRTYDPPDIPGYFEQVVWPEAQQAKYQMLSQDSSIVVLDGTLPLQVLLDIMRKVISRMLSNKLRETENEADG